MAQPRRRLVRIVRPLRGGQITIPSEFRKQLAIGPDSLLELSLVEGELRMRPVSVAPTVAGSSWLKELYDAFAPVRAQAQQHRPTEIDAAIESAVKAVRRRKRA